MFSVNKTEFTEGFQMTFTNKMTVSVQFGKVNHRGSTSAEVAVWDDNDTWFILDQDEHLTPVMDGTDVMGWVPVDQVADIISKVANF